MTSNQPLRGACRVPGDKSISHRALMIAALASGRSRLQELSDAADPASTASCLRALGSVIEPDGASTLVGGTGLHGLRPAPGPLDCGNSGTTMRLLAGILSGHPFQSELTGDPSLRRRPMERVAGPLRNMGANVETQEQGRPPVRIGGRRPLTALDYTAPLPSAQVKSAILLAGLFADGTTTVIEPVATRDHTERMLGLSSERTDGGTRCSVEGGRTIEPLDMEIPGDCSAAVFLIGAAAVLTGSEITIARVGVNPHRTRVLRVLRSWGILIDEQSLRTSGGEPVADLHIRSGEPLGDLHLQPDDVAACIDEVPALALTALAAGKGFSVRGAAELRTKESDRIAVIVEGLRALSVEVEEHPDGFAFEGKNDVRSATIRTDGDHRIAMAFSLAALRFPGILIDDPSCVSVSFPAFFSTLDRLRGRSG